MKTLAVIAALAFSSSYAQAACTEADMAGTWQIMIQRGTLISCTVEIDATGVISGCSGSLKIAARTCRWKAEFGSMKFVGATEKISLSSSARPNIMIGVSAPEPGVTPSQLSGFRLK